jgi:hypothetical protein
LSVGFPKADGCQPAIATERGATASMEKKTVADRAVAAENEKKGPIKRDKYHVINDMTLKTNLEQTPQVL